MLPWAGLLCGSSGKQLKAEALHPYRKSKYALGMENPAFTSRDRANLIWSNGVVDGATMVSSCHKLFRSFGTST